MKSKLLIVLSLLLVFGIDGLVLAEKTKGNNSGAAFKPDGVAVTNRQRRRKRRRRYRAERPTISPVTETGGGNGAMPDQPSPPPPPPVVEEAPVVSAPPPASGPGMDTPGRGRPKRSGAPRIKPPTVNIKPPTE